MKFSALVLASLFAVAFAAPAEDASANALARRAPCNPDDVGGALSLKKREDENDDDAILIVDSSLNENQIFSRADTRHCANCAPIKRVKADYKGNCHPNKSKGFKSAHNCKKDSSGKSYLCVQNNVATCYSINRAVQNNYENGECFK